LLKLNDAWPDVVTLFVLWHALHGDPKGRYVPGMLVGLIRDVFSACPFGAYTVIYGLMHRQVASRRYALRRENPVAQVILAFLCVFMVNCAMHAFLWITSSGIGWTAAIVHSATIAALSAPFMPLVCWGMSLGLRALGTARRNGENWAV
jgi:rod shape-determining protein MreD